MKCALEHCEVEEQEHYQRWVPGLGWHSWIQPSKELIAKRLRKKYGLQ